MPLLEITNLRTYFHTDDGVVKAVDDVSLRLEEGRTLGIVGESGSGKSVTSLSIMKLLAGSAVIETGRISFLGRDLVQLPEPEMRRIRGSDISMIFQEPMTSLNPVFTTGNQVAEAIILHQKVSKSVARKRTIELFREVGIPDPEDRVDYYPHQMSGGQKQRVMIAMALSCNPKLLIADEPTTALDVTIQKQILDIIRALRDERGMSIIFITHDLGVIAEIADDVAVMFNGKVVEYGDIVQIFSDPKHPYTKGLLACRPQLETKYRKLPTVDDFMETKEVDGEVKVIEKRLSEERLHALMTEGRGRLLHSKSELKAMGHPWSEIEERAGAEAVPEGTKPLLEVNNLMVHFPVRKGLLRRVAGYVKAVDGISFKVYKGQTLGLVGESGCGKTTAGRAILRLLEPTAGEVFYENTEMALLNPFAVCPHCGRRMRGEGIHGGSMLKWLVDWKYVLGCGYCLARCFPLYYWYDSAFNARESLRSLRRQMQIIFQDPYGSLNPRMTIESALIEPMRIHGIGSSKQDRLNRAAALLEEVDMLPEHLRRYPHEFSGGQRQRICIARALTVEPEFIICDESVSALDVSVQAQVLNLLNDLQDRRGLTYIFISHDLSVVKFMADMMAVMNHGKIIEFGPSENIYANPQEAYTKKLIEATPKDDIEHIKALRERREQMRTKRIAAN